MNITTLCHVLLEPFQQLHNKFHALNPSLLEIARVVSLEIGLTMIDVQSIETPLDREPAFLEQLRLSSYEPSEIIA